MLKVEIKKEYEVKPLCIQCLNLDCPKCGSLAGFKCISLLYKTSMDEVHKERIRAMQDLIEDSSKDWLVRKILRERNFAR